MKNYAGFRIYFLIFFLSLFYSSLFSQKDDFIFEHLLMKEGLSMNPVMSIVQDDKGFLWFGTQDGLNRFDGYKFNIYKTIDGDSASISDNFIVAQCVDHLGNLWVGTHNGGLNRYDFKTGKFKRFLANSSLGFGLKSNRIWCLMEDEHSQLWIGNDDGIAIINTKNGEFVNYFDKYSSLAKLKGIAVLSLFQESGNTIWFGTTSGAVRYDSEKDRYELFSHSFQKNSLSNNVVLSFFKGRNGAVWIGTAEGLNKFNPGSNSFSSYYFKEKIFSESTIQQQNEKNIFSIINNYGGNTIRCIFEDEEGFFWIGTDMELIIFNPANGTFINYKKDLINPTGINDHFIRSIFKDRSGNLWIGTMGNGLNKVDLKPKKFRHYQKKINNPFSLSENYVRTIEEDLDGNIWVGTLIGGLNRFDVKEEKFYHYKNENANDKNFPNDNNVWSLAVDRNNFVWVGTNKGLNMYDPGSKKFTYYVHDKDNPGSLSENTVRAIFQDRKGNLWVGTEGGLNKFDYENRNFKKYTKGSSFSSISDNTVWKICEDQKGNLWLATNDGLNRLDPYTETFKVFRKKPEDPKSISHNGIRTLFFDKKGNLWVGTQNGLNKFDEASELFTRFDENNGLPNSFIYGILEDEENNLWLSTNKGLCCFNPEIGHIRNFDIYDGLQDYEFNTNACCKTRTGEMYFAGPGGLNRFHPEKIPFNKFSPKVEITGIRVLDKEMRADSEVTELQSITLNYFENILTFEFSSLDFSNPGRNQYSYMMEGFNKDWVMCGNTRITNYTNLDPGEYIFKVKGTNSDGIWNDNSDQIKITILPPFWKTNVFYFLSLMAIAFLIYSIYRMRVRNLQKEKKILEEKVQNRTKDLEEEKKKVEQINTELEKLSIVASETDNAVVIADENGDIEWVNEGFTRMYGKLDKFKDIRGINIMDSSSNPEIRKLVLESIHKKQSVQYETLNSALDEKLFWTHSTLTPIFKDNDELKKIVVIDTDITQRKNAEEIIREKNKDITDSINYAKRIQLGILPSQEELKECLQNYFILFRPKDIVSGDFYWCLKTTTSDTAAKLSVVAAIDYTGHGVPGAFMSLLGYSLLNQTIKNPEVNSPADVLNYLNRELPAVLKSQGKELNIKDGMDIALCAFNRKKMKLYYSGANRPLLIIRNNEIIEFKADKQAISPSRDAIKKPYTNHEINLQTGDTFYLFTDGFTDQFGGPKGKKFKYAQFQKLLLAIQEKTMPEQGKILENTFTAWRGDLEQIDDICVIGIRI